MRTTPFVIGCLFVVLSSSASAQTTSPKPFEPVSGQAGKDVVWVPSPPEMVNKMMQMAKVGPSDVVIDLGSGDGRNVIAAAKLGAGSGARLDGVATASVSPTPAAAAGAATRKAVDRAESAAFWGYGDLRA
jgi:hypothetical protein